MRRRFGLRWPPKTRRRVGDGPEALAALIAHPGPFDGGVLTIPTPDGEWRFESVPPHGTCPNGQPDWWCSLGAGHDGPCPLRQEPTRGDLLRRNHGDCHIPDHHDALRRLGEMIQERNAWRERALLAESRLSHPSRGQQAA